MASFITHYYMADEVAKQLEGKAGDIVSGNRNIYDTGCQGNDLLFYVFGRYRGYASITHNSRTYEMLISMCNYVKTTGRDDLRAYLYGYICHYALDSAIHPYVIYVSGTHLPPYYPEYLHKSLHLLMEGGIDYVITRDYMHKDPLTFHAADELLHCDENVCICAADMTANAIDNVYMVDVPYEKLMRMPVRMHRYQKIFEDTKTTAFKGLMAAGKLGGYPSYIYGFIKPKAEHAKEDWMNTSRREFPCTTGGNQMSDKTVDEILRDSISKAIELITAADNMIDNGITLPKELIDRDYMGHTIQ